MSANKLSGEDLVLLEEIVKLTKKQSYMFTAEGERANLCNHEFVEPNGDIIDPTDPLRVATRATAKGMNFMTTDKAATEFEIEDDVPMPKAQRADRDAKYPIPAMSIGQSFHIGQETNGDGEVETMEALGKRVASIVSAANQKFAVSQEPKVFKTRKRKSKNKETGKITEKIIDVETKIATKKFAVRGATKDDKKGEGFRVFRIALPVVKSKDVPTTA